MASRQAITAALATIEEIYGDSTPLSPTRVQVWAEIFDGDLTDAELLGGLKLHMQDPEAGRFPPKPADIIARIRNPKLERETASADTEAFIGMAVGLVASKRYYAYNPNGGYYDQRRMREELGLVVAEAFEMSGGAEAWDGPPKGVPYAKAAFTKLLRERLPHEVAIGRFDPARALTMAPHGGPALPAGPITHFAEPANPAHFTDKEATDIIETLEGRLRAIRETLGEGAGHDNTKPD